VKALIAFFEDRLKVMLKSEGVRHDVIAAVMAGGEDDLLLISRKAKALQVFLDNENGANLLAAYTRASNILAAEEKKDGARFDGAPSSSIFEQPEEEALFAALEAAEPKVNKALKEEAFAAVMQALSALRGPLDAYFDGVMVNAEDDALRENRLKTLNRIRAAILQVADFERIEG